MFKMNKLLSKHISPLHPTKQSGEIKRLKVEPESAAETSELSPPSVAISDALAKFFGTGAREMLQSEALRRVWEYIKVNRLEVGRSLSITYMSVKFLSLFRPATNYFYEDHLLYLVV